MNHSAGQTVAVRMRGSNYPMVIFRDVARVLLVAGSLSFANAEFRASAVKVDITPKSPQWLMGYGPRQSTGIHTPIFHRVAAIDDGTTQVFFIASDLCLFSPSVYDDVTADLKQQTGVDPKQV